MLQEKDKKILELIQQDAKLTTKQLAKKLLLPITTIHNRIKKLEKAGIITNYKAVVDEKKLGKTISAYILINIEYKAIKKKKLTQNDLAAKIKKHPDVKEADVVAGRKDLIVKVSTKDVEELNEFIGKYIHALPGIKQTETLIVLG